jgi:hypothetical protein
MNQPWNIHECFKMSTGINLKISVFFQLKIKGLLVFFSGVNKYLIDLYDMGQIKVVSSCQQVIIT